MGETVEVKKGIFGKLHVFYTCPRCHNELESDLENAGESETCPICKMVFSVPGKREWQQIQEAKRQKQLERERIRSVKERKAQEHRELLAKEAKERQHNAEERELLREKRFLREEGLDEQGRIIRESEPSSQQGKQKGFLSYEGTGSLAGIGGLFLAGGLACAGYFFFAFDTSVAVPITQVFGQYVGGGRINNLGLMNERTSGIIIGMGLAVIGTIFIAVSSNRSDK